MSKDKDKQTRRQNAPPGIDQLCDEYQAIYQEWKSIIEVGRGITSKFTETDWDNLEKTSWNPKYDTLSMRVDRYRKAQTELARHMAQLWVYWNMGGDKKRHSDEAVKAKDAERFMLVRKGLAEMSAIMPMTSLSKADRDTLAQIGIEMKTYSSSDEVRVELAKLREARKRRQGKPQKAQSRKVRQAQRQREQAQEAQKRRHQQRRKEQQDGQKHDDTGHE